MGVNAIGELLCILYCNFIEFYRIHASLKPRKIILNPFVDHNRVIPGESTPIVLYIIW